MTRGRLIEVQRWCSMDEMAPKVSPDVPVVEAHQHKCSLSRGSDLGTVPCGLPASKFMQIDGDPGKAFVVRPSCIKCFEYMMNIRAKLKPGEIFFHEVGEDEHLEWLKLEPVREVMET